MTSRFRYPLLLTISAVTYIASGRIGLQLAFVNESATAVWPPAGLAIATLLLLGLRAWPAVAIGAFVVNLSTSGVALSSAGIALGNTLEALAGAWLTLRFASGRNAFGQMPDIVRFVLIAAGASTIAASIGSVTLMATGLANRADVGAVWFTWWLGDATGALVVTPLIVLCASAPTIRWSASRGLEAAALLLTVFLLALLIFGPSPAGAANYPLGFILIAPLLWAAFRFGGRETAVASAFVAVITVMGTLSGYGPFYRTSPNESLLLLQAFIGGTTVMALSVAAEIASKRSMEFELRALNSGLESHVAARTDELLQANARLTEAQGVAHVGSWEWDVGADRIWWSDELFRIYGLPPGTAMNYDEFLARVHPDDRDRVQGHVRQAMDDCAAFSFEHRIVTAAGEVRALQAAGRVVTDAAQRPSRMMGIGLDISERNRAEEERSLLIQEQAARREAEEASRAKDAFLAVLSHELRTPLNVALGWAHTLRDFAAGDPRAPRAAEAIYRNLLLQARLVSDIVDASRMARGAMVLETGSVDLHEVIQAALAMVREPALARRIRIEESATGPLRVMGDGKRLQQVLWNVLANAVRFGRDDGSVRVEARSTGTAVTITVEDDGPGIDQAFLPQVFEPFRQGDASSTRQHDGLGLGLAIARHIVELHGGTISAANAPVRGAVFSIELPVGVEERVLQSTPHRQETG